MDFHVIATASIAAAFFLALAIDKIVPARTDADGDDLED